MGWNGWVTYLIAKNEVRQIELYAMDLLWSIARTHYSSDIPMPSEIWNKKQKNDRRTAKQIKEDLLKGLGGG